VYLLFCASKAYQSINYATDERHYWIQQNGASVLRSGRGAIFRRLVDLQKIVATQINGSDITYCLLCGIS